MNYVDGFITPVPRRKLKAYRAIAKKAGKLFREYGALEFRECLIEDPRAPMGIPFPKLAKLKPGETVMFSWIVFKSRAHRDKVNRALWGDPRFHALCDINNTPFDPDRMSYGGFKVLVKV